MIGSVTMFLYFLTLYVSNLDSQQRHKNASYAENTVTRNKKFCLVNSPEFFVDPATPRAVPAAAVRGAAARLITFTLINIQHGLRDSDVSVYIIARIPIFIATGSPRPSESAPDARGMP